MGILSELQDDQGYLKAGFLGFTASGKTYTATLLAIATRNYFKLDGPIAMFDTEGGSQYLKGWVQEITGKPLLGVRARSFDKLLEFGRECEGAGVSVAIVDSIAHPWEELKESFLADINAARAKKQWDPRGLEFQDWAKIKPTWGKWTDFYLNSRLHIIVCGRAGDIYEMEKNEETGRKELSKVGVKMQTEKNFGYEPSLLVEMAREQILEPTTHFIRRATVWKDRFGMIDGLTCDFQSLDPKGKHRRERELETVWNFFGQHVRCIKAGAHAAIDVESKTKTGADEVGDDSWQREKRTRTILAEEVEAELFDAFPGQTGDMKKKRQEMAQAAFGTKSWTAISESTDSKKLREGLRLIRLWLRQTQAWLDLVAQATTPEQLDDIARDLDDASNRMNGEEVVAIRRERDKRKVALQQQVETQKTLLLE